jgi:hypothetical protein
MTQLTYNTTGAVFEEAALLCDPFFVLWEGSNTVLPSYEMQYALTFWFFKISRLESETH